MAASRLSFFFHFGRIFTQISSLPCNQWPSLGRQTSSCNGILSTDFGHLWRILFSPFSSPLLVRSLAWMKRVCCVPMHECKRLEVIYVQWFEPRTDTLNPTNMPISSLTTFLAHTCIWQTNKTHTGKRTWTGGTPTVAGVIEKRLWCWLAFSSSPPFGVIRVHKSLHRLGQKGKSHVHIYTRPKSTFPVFSY